MVTSRGLCLQLSFEKKCLGDDAAGGGAGDGNRTRMTSLEGWSSTIELHPQPVELNSNSGRHNVNIRVGA